MNRRLIAVLVMLLGVVFLVRPYESHAETQMQKIERQLKEIQAQMNAAAENKKEAERRSEDLTNKKGACQDGHVYAAQADSADVGSARRDAGQDRRR
ncbi:hypothetical protein OMP38_30100 [Cohnella ginsengisoli]|uniref:Uncharacterized protein n=1 Tax=Cohnella ginsengisoli TaxID=425004 RepID=A0A9X4KMB7_9BACL|nr:hypothetical protein [Cohnella ginsengisoli]MDG0794621.1 hypothetical protein [Cohnella ginsengisoli]